MKRKDNQLLNQKNEEIKQQYQKISEQQGELLKTQDHLIKTEKLASLGQFMAGVCTRNQLTHGSNASIQRKY